MDDGNMTGRRHPTASAIIFDLGLMTFLLSCAATKSQRQTGEEYTRSLNYPAFKRYSSALLLFMNSLSARRPSKWDAREKGAASRKTSVAV
jgi:hypothetical protein